MNPAPLLTALFLFASATAAHAQSRLDEPPRLPPASASEQEQAAAQQKSKSVIRMSERERQAIDQRREAAAGAAAPKSPVKDELAPVPGEPVPADIKTQPYTKIEQRRQGNRVVEVIVTPAGSRSSYTIQNREGQPPRSPTEPNSNLSLPQFFRYDF